MAKTDIWMPLYIGDFLRDTVNLSFDEKSFYMMILINLWCMGGESTVEDIRDSTGYSKKKFEKKFEKISRFFSKSGNRIFQKRLLAEKKKANENSLKKSANAKKRWEKPSVDGCKSNANAKQVHMQMQCPSPSPSSLEKKEKEKTSKKKKLAAPKIAFEKSEWYDFQKLKDSLPDWTEEKVQYYHESACGYSKANRGRYSNWRQAILNWHRRDLDEGRGYYHPNRLKKEESNVDYVN